MDELLDWRSRIAPPQKRIFEIALNVARDTGVRLFTAGGPVRDLVLGTSFVDIDLVVEAGGEAFAARLARALDGEVEKFPKFLTWRIDTGDGFPIDVTTARTEVYAHPGSLPEVAPSRLREDLFRRDFAANAVALDLISDELIDPAGGLSDIRDRTMRVLHPRSFIDDPTRILRGIRIATRLDFHLEPETADLVRQAVANDALGTISRERVWREIFIATKEAHPSEALLALGRWGLLESFLFHPSRSDDLLGAVERNSSVDRIDWQVVYTGILIDGSAQPERSLSGTGFSKARAKKAVTLVEDARLLTQKLAQAPSALEELRLCARSSDEIRLVASALEEDAALKIKRFSGYPQFALDVRGDELGLPAGPHIARALEEAREAVYLEVIPPEAARTFARNIGLKYLNGETDENSGA